MSAELPIYRRQIDGQNGLLLRDIWGRKQYPSAKGERIDALAKQAVAKAHTGSFHCEGRQKHSVPCDGWQKIPDSLIDPAARVASVAWFLQLARFAKD